MLKAQVARAKALGFTPMMATELEFFLFEKSFDEIRRGGFRDLRRSRATTRITTSSRPPRKSM
jgi:glutamine synthetase